MVSQSQAQYILSNKVSKTRLRLRVLKSQNSKAKWLLSGLLRYNESNGRCQAKTADDWEKSQKEYMEVWKDY